MKNLLNKKLFELFDKKVVNYSLFDKFLNPYLNPSLVVTPPPPSIFNAVRSGVGYTPPPVLCIYMFGKQGSRTALL
jgi:hypothetical protein